MNGKKVAKETQTLKTLTKKAVFIKQLLSLDLDMVVAKVKTNKIAAEQKRNMQMSVIRH